MEGKLQASGSLGGGDSGFIARSVSNAPRQGLPCPLTVDHPLPLLQLQPEPYHPLSGPSRGKWVGDGGLQALSGNRED